MSPPEAPVVFTVREAAAYLRIGRNQAYELVRRGELFGVRIGRSVRIPRSAIEAMLSPKSNGHEPDQPVTALELASVSSRPSTG